MFMSWPSAGLDFQFNFQALREELQRQRTYVATSNGNRERAVGDILHIKQLDDKVMRLEVLEFYFNEIEWVDDFLHINASEMSTSEFVFKIRRV